ncbi:hypothetical protein [Planktotalea sp.]|uniref:hypothetical protein n=1 Tax=Planktotalea sp. TaxID=2029877 RepID=UPI0025D09ABE|nr:hypothetical protein [Planktotalea sp.]
MPQTFWDVFGLKNMQPALRVALGFMWAVLFAAFLGAVIWTLLSIAQAILRTPGEDFRLYLLTLAAMTAGLSALIALPFTLIRTKNLTAQTNATEQGLVTDRLNKAVEGLARRRK